jgi:hypothetical protein
MNLNDTPAMDELDQLLAESVKPKKSPKHDLMDLDDLLTESLAIRDEAQATAGMREKLKRSNLSGDERREIEAKVREWEARNLWNPVATVIVFERVICSCGCYYETFSHMMNKQAHKHNRDTTRLIIADTINDKLPKMKAFQVQDVDICTECSTEKGWDLESMEEIEWQAPEMRR